jgi:hypothetical protein
VTRIVTALKAHHAAGALCQPIDQLALAFVTPLGTDNDYVTTYFVHCTHQITYALFKFFELNRF